VAGKDDSDLLAKVRCAMESDRTLALYAAVQRHCGEKTENAVEAAYKRVRRKINLGK
jgi:excisionase family DNA binding protein